MRLFPVPVLVALAGCASGDAPPLGVGLPKAPAGEICDGEDNDADGATDEDCGQCDRIVTRGKAWWRTHTCVVAGNATGFAILPVSIGASTTLATPGQVRSFLAAAATTPQQRLGQELATARLNTIAFFLDDLPYDDWNGDGTDETVGDLLILADTLYDGGGNAARQRMAAVLAALNTDGASFGAWFSETCAAEPEYCNGLDDDGDGVVDDDCACGASVPADHACGGYAGLDNVGRTWVYSFTDGSTATSTVTVTALSDSGVQTHASLHIDSGGFVETDEYDYVYTCGADGVGIASFAGSFETTEPDGSEWSGWSAASYDPPCVSVRPEMAVGDDWECSSTIAYDSDSTGPFESPVEITYSVLAAESVTVPAGTFDTLVVESAGDSWASHAWYADGVGSVQSDSAELSSFAP